MQDVIKKTDYLKGGEFIIKDAPPTTTFVPEAMNEDQKMIKDMVMDFVMNEVEPVRDKLEKQEPGLSTKLLEKAGELGLLGTHMPAAYGGMDLDTNTNTIIGDHLGYMGVGFTVTITAHTGIGMLPILYFGTEEQKNKYLPGLISGELKAAYCLTEPGSGSDALGAKTRADETEDKKHYLINGQKMWISNAGFADIFIVFAQVGGDKFTGFIVERNVEGLSFGEEEDKMGIHASSTRQVFFENVKVPAGNILGEIGKGHLIAFNALNIGRFKLCAMCVGGSRRAIALGVQYANERHQFDQPIASFGAIQYKIAEQTIRNFAVESALYRTSQMLQDKKQELIENGEEVATATRKAAEEYAIECAILKVAGSESLDYVVDELVQIYGGIGYSEEYGAAQAYRDSRINRIYEGTNEINRLLTVQMLLRRATKGAIDVTGPAWAVQKELSSMPKTEKPEGTYGQERAAIQDFKKILLMVAGAAAKMQEEEKLNLKEEQMIVMNISDIMIDTFIAESLLLRVEKLAEMEEKPHQQEIYEAMLRVYINDMQARIEKNAKDALASFVEGDLLRTFLMGVKRYTKYPPYNVKAGRRLVARQLIEANDYCF